MHIKISLDHSVNKTISSTMALNEKILSYLKDCTPGNTHTALQIAKAVGLKTSKDVNGVLYRLKATGHLHASDDSPPQWSLQTYQIVTPVLVKKEPPKYEVNLVQVLKADKDGKGMTAKQIAKQSNQERKDVNRTLYSLREQGKVEKSGEVWKLKDVSDLGDGVADDLSDKLESGLSFCRDFDFIKQLGHGGYGRVYQVKHKLDDKFYAMKIVDYNREAEREVRALASCDHPNIIRYFTAWPGDFDHNALGSHSTSEELLSNSQASTEDEEGEFSSNGDSPLQLETESESESKCSAANPREERCLFIQMEFCEKGTLLNWLEDRNFGKSQKTREDALEVFQQVVRGVEYIHSKRLIHRDLKPANILFKNENCVKIGDFGLVTSVTNKNSGNMKRTLHQGTPSYMSPEQKDQKDYDEKTDIFPLGLICFELLWKISTGFERGKIWPDIRNQVFPPEFCKVYSSEHKLISEMLSKSPEMRPAAAEIAKFIETFLLSEMDVLNPRTW